jgi:purine-nucleoside/S-methyl-5'-thioadenosine phosphorylase / adenosine deaminase
MLSSSRPKTPPAAPAHPSAVQEIDAAFEAAGLVRSLARNLRGKAAGITRRARVERAAPEELSPAVPVPTMAANGVQVIRVASWDKPGSRKTEWLWHGFSTRKGGLSRAYCTQDAPGDLNLGFTAADDKETVAKNRQLLVEAVTGDPATSLVTLRQIHSSVVAFGAAEDAGRKTPRKGDGLMTDEPGILLGIQTADCIPVLVADRKRHVVAAFHAGWRGTVKRIVESGVGRMRLEFGSRPEDLIAAIGPGIGVCCYAVGEEVLSSFESQFANAGELFREVDDADEVRRKYPMLFLTQRAPGHSPMGPSLHVDLVEANRRQLMDAGLRPRSIQTTGGCTSCHRELFFSHRASHGHAGRMLSVIGIRPR